MISTNEIKKIEKIIGYNFNDKKLITSCFQHSSIIKKRLKGQQSSFVSDYERLEFLGDRVLGLNIAHMIFNEFPNYPEGKMSVKFTYLVQKNFLSNIAIELKLYDFIETSRDKNINIKNNKSILADTLEALIGAIFIDGGYVKSTKFIKKIWKKFILDESLKVYDPKTILQELSQKKSKKLPTYNLIEKKGPPHSPRFTVSVSCLNFKEIIGNGSSKREAERSAANNFLKLYKNNNER